MNMGRAKTIKEVNRVMACMWQKVDVNTKPRLSYHIGRVMYRRLPCDNPVYPATSNCDAIAPSHSLWHVPVLHSCS